jgi:hypothetical protein
MRQWIYRLHLYGGLLCAAYLVVFGLSSLQFNHHFAWAASSDRPEPAWEVPLPPLRGTNDVARAENLRDDLGLMGWPLPWEMRRDDDGLHVVMERPGRSYRIHALTRDGRVRVEPKAKGFWPAVVSLHGLTGIPGSRLASWWGVYTELCVWVVLFAAASGVWLWIGARRERVAGRLALALGFLGSVAFMVYVVVKG